MRKAYFAIAAVAMAATLSMAGGAMAQYGGSGLSVSSTTVEPGGSVALSGGGFAPNADVTITLESDPVTLERTTADSSGFLEETVKIPSGTPPGTHTLKASGRAEGGGTQVLSTQIVLRAAGGATAGGGGGGALPFTGTDVTLFTAVAAGLAAIGSALWQTGRRRQRVRDE
jgi:hypothetical protein